MPIHANGGSQVTMTSAGVMGSAVAQAPFTMAAIVNVTDFGNWRQIFGCDGQTFFLTSGGGAIRLEENGTNTDSPTIVVPTGTWVLVSITKASGTAAPRFHMYRYSTNAWTHESSAGTTGANNYTGNHFYVAAQPAFGNNFLGEIEVIGHWQRVLTDAELENLPFTLDAWYSAKPSILLKADPTSVKLSDSSQDLTLVSTDAGITASTVSVPLFNYADGVWVPTAPVPAGGGTTFNDTVSGTITLSGSRSESYAASYTETGTLTLSGTRSEAFSQAYAPSGTITLAGTSSQSYTAAYAPTGTVTLSGFRSENTGGVLQRPFVTLRINPGFNLRF